MVFELGQPRQVDVGALEHHVLARPGIDLARRDRLLHRLEVLLQHPAGRRVHRHGEPRPAGVEVGEHRVVAAPDVLEQENGAALRLLLDLDHRGRHLVAGVHLAGDGDELVRPFGAHALEEGGEILGHVSPLPVRSGGTLANGAWGSQARGGAAAASKFILRLLSAVMPGLVPGIHVGPPPRPSPLVSPCRETWMPGTSPGMTALGETPLRRSDRHAADRGAGAHR